ncbi:MAG: hypothetical protein ABIH10_01075 [Spirochaetota bacterium]
MELIVFFLVLVVLFFFQIRKSVSNNDTEAGQKVKKKKKISTGWIVLIILLPLAMYLGYKYYNKTNTNSQAQTAIQIYPNYQFPKDVIQINIPLIPENQLLSREAGGWVITPAGSNFRIDYDIPIVIEYIDGRRFYRQPGKPAYDGVRPNNSIFRLYGKEGNAKVTIKRKVYR